MPCSVSVIIGLLLFLLLSVGPSSPLLAAPEAESNPGNAPKATTFTADWPKAYFRGTPNNWGATAMSLVADHVWETSQDFTGQAGPRFRIDRNGDWLEAYPAQDYVVTTPGNYRIQFNDQTRQITLILLDTGWKNAYLRGTPNNWKTTAMNKAGDLWEITQDFTGQSNPRFKIDRQGDWSESYPAQDYAVQAKKYRVQFNDRTKAITVAEILPTTAATPTISPNGGKIFTSQPVVLGATTANATLYYTTDGSTPTTQSAVYSTPFALPAGSITVKAITVKPGLQNSTEAEAVFTVEQPSDTIRVYVKDFSKIYYWNVQPANTLLKVEWPGKDLQAHASGWRYYEFPGVNSINLIFNGPGQTADLSRTKGTWWYKNGSWTAEDPDRPVRPVIVAKPMPGKFTEPQKVALEGSNPDDKIYYTTDGSTPTAASTVYKEPLSVPAGVTPLKAIGINRDQVTGQEYAFIYDINPDYDLMPPEVKAGPPSGSYPAAISVAFTITDNKAGAKAYYTTDNREATTADSSYLSATPLSVAKTTRFNFLAVDAAGNSTAKEFLFEIGPRADFRRETIYFVITSRFYDGDPGNNTYCWDDQVAGNRRNNDPCWRGDFKGLIEKLDYIKALGFSAIWITPVVKNMSGYDYHGYHAVNHQEVDPRYLSADTSYQDLIDAAHAKGLKVIQDIVFNHTSNFGEENLYPLFKKDATKLDIPLNLVKIAPPGKLPADYDSLNPGQQYQARIAAMKEDAKDTQHIYHHEKSLCWECYQVETGQIAGDCVDLNTENPATYQYLTEAYNRYIDMGVDAFRVDTVKHISRLTFNKVFLPAFRQQGGDDFYIFGEIASRFRQVWNHDTPAISTPFYTWKEAKDYAWSSTDRLVNENSTLQNYNDNSTVAGQPSSDNYRLINNTYRPPNWSRRSHLDVIDFPMHWNFNNAHDAFRIAVDNDNNYNDATWNVTYVDSHDYAPDGAPEDKRFSGSQATWAENLSLIFTFRGIPTIYYGSEIEFKKGFPIDKGPTVPLEETGRAYFGDRLTGSVAVSNFGVYANATGNLETTLNHPLAQHIRRLNLIRRAVPALQRGQYSTENIAGSDLAFKRRYTDAGTDSFALVTLSGDATFNGIPNGTYKDAITGDVKAVSNGTLATSGCHGQGNLRVYVLDTALTPAPGKVGEAGAYLQ
jgi:glycosidase